MMLVNEKTQTPIQEDKLIMALKEDVDVMNLTTSQMFVPKLVR